MDVNNDPCKTINKAIEEVSSETIRGASWSMLHIIRSIMETIEHGQDPCSCKGLSEKIIEANPTMTPLAWISYIYSLTCEKQSRNQLYEILPRILDYRNRANDLIREHFRTLVRESSTILTLSYSSTIEQALLSLPLHRRPKIIVLESRPGSEGLVFGENLSRHGFNVEIIPDMLMHIKLEQADFAVVGADSVTLDGCVFNKLGTHLLAIVSKQLKKPLYIMFDSLKLDPFRKCKDIPVLYRKIKINNHIVSYPVFDATPIEMVSGLVTEHGILEPTLENLRYLLDQIKETLGIQ